MAEHTVAARPGFFARRPAGEPGHALPPNTSNPPPAALPDELAANHV